MREEALREYSLYSKEEIKRGFEASSETNIAATRLIEKFNPAEEATLV